MTADELGLSGVSGYSKPSNVKANTSQKSLTITLVEDIQVQDQATFAVVFEPSIDSISAIEDHVPGKFIDVCFPDGNGNLKHYKTMKVAPDFDINEEFITRTFY